ncbi:thiamine biosynthesis protein [Sorangium cellulosum]|uniref:Thiamine biosynthesis protein n=1 Tax=Sorangium cellulosum TaxID=56 RepID=A0A4P2Q3A4_SORCE|nr:thiamine biosynthesis protein [Sorangium cellulosum]AUX23468.1 thiamine biosynthesis protein [Sorangium cellulosum]
MRRAPGSGRGGVRHGGVGRGAVGRGAVGRARGAAPAAARLASVALLALSLCAPLACRRESSTGATVAPPPSGPPPTAAPRPPSPRLTDPRWRRAAGDDPLELARLAEAEGATELLAALDDGGEIERTALRALPYADDADLGLAPLAERARAAPVASLGPLLEALLGIAGRPPRPREPLDPDGLRVAAAVLLELSGRQDLPAAQRALAISAARALADKGLLDPGRIPADLDPDVSPQGSAAGQAPP